MVTYKQGLTVPWQSIHTSWMFPQFDKHKHECILLGSYVKDEHKVEHDWEVEGKMMHGVQNLSQIKIWYP